jgi:hypothetical protein
MRRSISGRLIAARHKYTTIIHGFGKRLVFVSVVFVITSSIPVLLMWGCKDSIVNPPEKQPYTTNLKGKVILDNQAEYSNALVYLDSLSRGVATDSGGYYDLQFTADDSVYNGTFKIYYFVNEYEMDSAQYVLTKGRVRLDSLNVDGDGNLTSKELRQLLRVEGWTDKQEYRIGDTIRFTARWTNVSSTTVHIFIFSIFNELGYVSLYNENYPSFSLSPQGIISDLDDNINVYAPDGFYEGHVVYTIPSGTEKGFDWQRLVPGEYIVEADLFIEGRFRSPYDRFERYVFDNWYRLCKGKSPRLDWFPNKYNYPRITIIE